MRDVLLIISEVSLMSNVSSVLICVLICRILVCVLICRILVCVLVCVLIRVLVCSRGATSSCPASSGRRIGGTWWPVSRLVLRSVYAHTYIWHIIYAYTYMYAYTMRDCALCMHIRMYALCMHIRICVHIQCEIALCVCIYVYTLCMHIRICMHIQCEIALCVCIYACVTYHTCTCTPHIRWHLTPSLALRWVYTYPYMWHIIHIHVNGICDGTWPPVSRYTECIHIRRYGHIKLSPTRHTCDSGCANWRFPAFPAFPAYVKARPQGKMTKRRCGVCPASVRVLYRGIDRHTYVHTCMCPCEIWLVTIH